MVPQREADAEVADIHSALAGPLQQVVQALAAHGGQVNDCQFVGLAQGDVKAGLAVAPGMAGALIDGLRAGRTAAAGLAVALPVVQAGAGRRHAVVGYGAAP